MNNKRIHYCKGLKKTGKPIVVIDLINDTTSNTDKIEGFGHWRVQFNNAKLRREKRSEVTTVLEVWD